MAKVTSDILVNVSDIPSETFDDLIIQTFVGFVKASFPNLISLIQPLHYVFSDIKSYENLFYNNIIQ